MIIKEMNIDDDITYLLSEIGHNVKVNNAESTAIINNSSMEKTYDDKKIITMAELKRGMYINYNDLNFILLNEVNDKRYLTYYKGTMRNCNYDVKFVIDSKLYLLYSFIESDKFALDSKQLITLSADMITVTLPSTEITEKIETGNRFISMGRAWKIQGLDKTKKGLINLICKNDITTEKDDMKNEIADVDVLNGKIDPILPFQEGSGEPEPEPEPEELSISGEDIITIYDKNVPYSINTDKSVEWSLSRTDIVKFTKKDGNKCYIQFVDKSKIGDFTLIATLEDGTVVNKDIELLYM